MRGFCFYILFFCMSITTYGQIRINEFMAKNETCIADETGKFEDWIEIYNASDTTIALTGYFLTDDLTEPQKWAFPDTSLESGQFLLIWTDDNPEDGPLHTNFKLSGSGEEIGLSDSTALIDSVIYGEQQNDVSCGRSPDGQDAWYYFESPTPNASNRSDAIPRMAIPEVSCPGGFYESPFSLTLTQAAGDTNIFYTLDGSAPSIQSIRYNTPIAINKTTVLRARTIQAGFLSSPIVTQTYILNHDLKVNALSLVTDPDNLWSPATGIYANPLEHGDEWERPVAVEYFDANQNSIFNINAGLRIHGQSSREFEKKSFRLYFDSGYGPNWLEEPLYPDKPEIDEFKRLIIHSGSADTPVGHSFRGWCLLRNPLIYELGRQVNLPYPASVPLALFLNGHPWGIYYLTERPDKYFLSSNFENAKFDLLEHGSDVHEGDTQAWKEMIRFFEHGRLYQSSKFEEAKSYIDLNNFTDYFILNIYGGNYDWPHNNSFSFRPRQKGAKWRWLLWDQDACFNAEKVGHKTLQSATEGYGQTTTIMARLLENENYKNYFINRFADLLNTTLSTDNVNALIDTLAESIEHDIALETNKWGSSPQEWREEGIKDAMHFFADRRVKNVIRHIEKKFSTRDRSLCLSVPQGGQGTVRINTIFISEFPWTGSYFRHIPVELEAIPAPGYRFVRWSITSLPKEPVVHLTLYNTDKMVCPVFEELQPEQDVVINEINYNCHPEFDPEDWVELYNASAAEKDISGWHFKDEKNDHDFIMPANTKVTAKGYLVLCNDTTAFRQHFPEVQNYLGNFDFNLSNAGELIRLYDATQNLIDSVIYDDTAPWPLTPDGDGPTLALLHPALDNALAESWQASENYGTPGAANNTSVTARSLQHQGQSLSNLFGNENETTITSAESLPTRYSLEQNYPNPFNPRATIAFGLPEMAHVRITIYNLLGQKVKELVNKNMSAGYHSIIWNATNEAGNAVNSGIYLCRFTTEKYRKVMKMTLIR
jgi:hypothetical protein